MDLSLSKSFTLDGHFSIPQENNNWSGTLYYDPDNGITLKLRNLPLSFEPRRSILIMNGLLDDKPHSCTLHNIIFQQNLFSDNSDGTTCMSTFHVANVYLGKHFNTVQELVFNEVSFTYSNLRQWLNKPNISTKCIDNEIVVKIPEPIEICGSLDELFNFKITIANFGSYSEKSFSSHFKQNVVFSILSKNLQPTLLRHYLDMNKIIKYFLMFLQGRYVIEESIMCNTTDEIFVDFIQFYNPYKPAKKPSATEQFTHKYDSLRFKTDLQNWIKKYREIPDFFDRFYENVIKEELSPIDKFENLIQSLLFYHKNRFSDEICCKDEYDDFFKKLLDKLDENEKRFVDRFRQSGNKISLRKQLKNIFVVVYPDIEHEVLNHNINKIVLLRNQIEHSTEPTTSSTLASVSAMTYNLTGLVSTLIRREIISST